MRWVEVAARLPQRCAFVPYIAGHHPRGYFMGDFELPGGDTPYVSVVAVEEMARQIGFLPPGDVTAERAELEQARALIGELEEKLTVAEAMLAAVHTLKQAGYQASRKTGRPPKQKEKV